MQMSAYICPKAEFIFFTRPTHLSRDSYFSVPITDIQVVGNDGAYYLAWTTHVDGAGHEHMEARTVLFGTCKSVSAHMVRRVGHVFLRYRVVQLRLIRDNEYEYNTCEACGGSGFTTHEVYDTAERFTCLHCMGVGTLEAVPRAASPDPEIHPAAQAIADEYDAVLFGVGC